MPMQVSPRKLSSQLALCKFVCASSRIKCLYPRRMCCFVQVVARVVLDASNSTPASFCTLTRPIRAECCAGKSRSISLGSCLTRAFSCKLTCAICCACSLVQFAARAFSCAICCVCFLVHLLCARSCASFSACALVHLALHVRPTCALVSLALQVLSFILLCMYTYHVLSCLLLWLCSSILLCESRCFRKSTKLFLSFYVVMRRITLGFLLLFFPFAGLQSWAGIALQVLDIEDPRQTCAHCMLDQAGSHVSSVQTRRYFYDVYF